MIDLVMVFAALFVCSAVAAAGVLWAQGRLP